MPTRDVVIVGGGVIGSAVAYFLALNGGLRVTVVERDPTYTQASSALSASSIRQQFSTPVCIEMSRFGMEFLKDIDRRLGVDADPVDVGLVERGYLYLADAPQAEGMRRNHAVQRANGADVELLAPDEVERRHPWLRAGDLALASYGRSGEGWFDGYSLLQAFRRKAISLGVEYLTDEVVAILRSGAKVQGVELAGGACYTAGTVVNAAGPYAGRVAALAGVEIPVAPERRTVFVFACRDGPQDTPLVIDPSGVYFRPEGAFYIVGGPATPSPDPFNLEPDYAQFEDLIWPTLAARVPAFESIKMTGAWAGHYEMNLVDHNALIGHVDGAENFVLANGFSGHGMQHAAAAGRGVAELILHGAFRSIDLSPLAPSRLCAGRTLVESNVI